MDLYDYFENLSNYKPKWHREVVQLEVKGFSGWYSLHGNDIPVFEIQNESIANQILILNKSKLGALIQKSPLNKGESEELRSDIFYMKVDAFSENNELSEKFLDNPPEWLKEKGEREIQKEHLKELVLIHIFERFEFNIHEQFKGYKINI